MKKKLRKLFDVINFPYLLFGFLIFVSVLSIGTDVSESKLAKSAHLSFVELSYMSESPFGESGGISVPASCESGNWNNNGGYHLDGVIGDPGNCGGQAQNPGNQPPETPIMGGTVRLPINSSIGAWDVRSKDPDGDRVFFEVDWDGSGSVDGTTPVVNSDQLFIAGHIYSQVGTYTIRARAREADWPIASNWINKFITTAYAQVSNNGKASGWGTYQVEVFDPTNPTSNSAPGAPSVTGSVKVPINQNVGSWQAVSIDPQGYKLFYEVDWNGDGKVDGTTEVKNSGDPVLMGHIYTETGTFTIKVKATQAGEPTNSLGGNDPISSTWTDFAVEVYDPMTSNAAPGTPVIGGDTFVRVGQATGNTIVSTDPEGDEVFYEIDWNGNSTIDGTTSSQPSGAVANIGHVYNTAGTYTVRGRAVQTNDNSKRSGWGTYAIVVSDDDKCVATANSCGVTSGTIVGGKCEPAALPSGYGTSCASAANVCGMTSSGTVGCNGGCVATVPSNTLCGCNSAPNKCGMTNPGSYDASGICLASTPSNTLCGCTSAANKCGMSTTGTYDASGNVCNAVTPSIKSCPMTINDFRASPKLVTSGKNSKLFWDITGDTDLCSIKYYTVKNPSLVTVLSSLDTDIGQQATTPITERRTYVLNCGSVQAEATIGPFILVEI